MVAVSIPGAVPELGVSLIQLADVLAHRRLAQTEALGGPGETPGLRDRKESLKQDRIEHGFASSEGFIITICDYNNSCKQTSQ